METEETNTTEVPEIHYWDFQIESGNKANEFWANLNAQTMPIS